MNLTSPPVSSVLLACAVLLGGLLVNIFNRNQKVTLQALLVFSGAFLLGISALHLIPEVYELSPYPGIFLLVGFMVQIFAESLSKGVEHGHHHPTGKQVFPLTILIGLFLHTYIEAIPMSGLDDAGSAIHNHHHHDHHHHAEAASEDTSDLASSFLWGVIAHKVPMAFALIALMMRAGVSSRKRFVWLAVFALSGPLGIFTGHFITNPDAVYALLAVALGSFLHVSTTIILESEGGHRVRFSHLLLVVSGFGLSYLLTMLY